MTTTPGTEPQATASAKAGDTSVSVSPTTLTVPAEEASEASEPKSYLGLSVLIDIVVVLLFTVIGRAAHGQDVQVPDVLTTAWPFLVGTLVGWIVTFAWRRPLAMARSGIGIWVATVAIGMLLRVGSGQGIGDTAGQAASFITVASIFNGLFLIGWRGIAAVILRQVAKSRSRKKPLKPSRG